MNINSNLADPNQIPYGTPFPLESAHTSQKWSQKDWLVKVYIPIIVPIIAALIGGGYFLLKPSSSSIPFLYRSYSGTYTDTTLGKSGQLTMSDVSENTSTGTFTASGTIETPGGTCFIQNTNGLITAEGKMTWVVTYEQSTACNAGAANVTGQLTDGVITGTWTNADPSIQDTGTFTLS